jgi:hypothetical protein
LQLRRPFLQSREQFALRSTSSMCDAVAPNTRIFDPTHAALTDGLRHQCRQFDLLRSGIRIDLALNCPAV